MTNPFNSYSHPRDVTGETTHKMQCFHNVSYIVNATMQYTWTLRVTVDVSEKGCTFLFTGNLPCHLII